MTGLAPGGTSIVGRPRRVVFAGLLLTGMAASTLATVSLSVLASFIIDDLEVNRFQVGALIAGNTIAAAFLSPRTGLVVDAVGGRRALAALFASAVAGFAVLAGSPVYALMFFGVAITAFTQAAGNPTTNKLIAEHLPVGERANVTGIKQSGVQLGVFAAGLLLPGLAEALGWRTALLLVAAVPAVLLPLVAVIPRDVRRVRSVEAAGPLPPSIRRLALYGFLMGLAGSVTFLVPLFVEEALDMSTRMGGLAAGLIGLISAGARLQWARVAERSLGYARVLEIVAVVGIGAMAVFLAADLTLSWLLWVAVVLMAVSNSSWNSVGMLAVMAEAGTARAGGASGVVMRGFLLGLGFGPPFFGWTVDVTGSYVTMWLVAIAFSLAGWVVATSWSRRRRVPKA